ncbi:hypothetical protein GSI_14891 [Ganoderma sinense ZZ0214-1]|uniref:Fungal-type protein kinase domain-containing protein n=1 Tax=Ganoderma sinense ZZ0214-1 TaxID=1077348 RepID=A0A2G8RQF6_9APHY|nr:hypothetical protein GSI_14891 [Ganoderma sinense ZZ0214-1]
MSHTAGNIKDDDQMNSNFSDSNSETDESERGADKVKHDIALDCGICPNVQMRQEGLTRSPRRSWHWIETPIKCKISPTGCPFTFDTHEQDFLHNGDEKGRKALEELARHMSHLFCLPHRTFAYAIYVFCNKEHLVYFNRSGAAVSEWCSFEEDLHLQRFVYRLAMASEVERGHNPAATLVPSSSQDAKDFRTLVDDVRQPELLWEWVAVSTKRKCPIYRLRAISEAAASNTDSKHCGETLAHRDFLVGHPHFYSDSLFGHCTRGYIALDAARKTLCFLKDSWRRAG